MPITLGAPNGLCPSFIEATVSDPPQGAADFFPTFYLPDSFSFPIQNWLDRFFARLLFNYR
jgi:hypothetical protein